MSTRQIPPWGRSNVCLRAAGSSVPPPVCHATGGPANPSAPSSQNTVCAHHNTPLWQSIRGRLLLQIGDAPAFLELCSYYTGSGHGRQVLRAGRGLAERGLDAAIAFLGEFGAMAAAGRPITPVRKWPFLSGTVRLEAFSRLGPALHGRTLRFRPRLFRT